MREEEEEHRIIRDYCFFPDQIRVHDRRDGKYREYVRIFTG